MINPDDTPAELQPSRSRTVLVTFLGAVVQQMGNWMPIGGTIDLMGQLGLDAPTVRTAVFRLKQRGWLASESRGSARGYTLTLSARRALSEGDEIIWTARQPADLADGWCIVNFSVPEKERAKRYQLRAHLASLGFGNAGTAMWIAPARMRSAAEHAVADLGLDKYAAIFVGEYVGCQDLTSLIYASWDLPAINERYLGFIDRYGDEVASLADGRLIDPQRAFTTYLGVIDHWRKLPFRDPGLPREVLAQDWGAPEASALLSRLVVALEGRALGHAARYWPMSG